MNTDVGVASVQVERQVLRNGLYGTFRGVVCWVSGWVGDSLLRPSQDDNAWIYFVACDIIDERCDSVRVAECIDGECLLEIFWVLPGSLPGGGFEAVPRV